MPSTYTPSLRQELQATGENETTWGEKLNKNFSEVLEQAIAGIATITMQNADHEMSVAFGAEDEARNAIVIVSGSMSAQRNLIVPAVSKVYVVRNITSGDQSLVVKTRDGQGVTVTNGEVGIVFCDGVNVVSAASALANGALVPSKISTSSSEWKLNGTLGVNVSVANEENIGKIGVNGATSARYQYYLNNALHVSTHLSTDYFNIESDKPIRFITTGATQVQINTDGTVACSKAITAVGVNSTTSIAANTSIQCGTTMAVGTNLTVGGASTFTGTSTFNNTVSYAEGVTFAKVITVNGTTTAQAINCTTLTASSNISLSSDARLKHKWLDYPADLVDKLAKVKAGSYVLKASGARGTRHVGIPAQDLQNAWSLAVDASDPAHLKVNLPYLNVSVVALAKRLVELEEKLAAMENKQ